MLLCLFLLGLVFMNFGAGIFGFNFLIVVCVFWMLSSIGVSFICAW